MDHSNRVGRRWLAIALAAVTLGLSACAGAVDWCGDGLNPPSGGWDRHAPG